MITLVTGTPGAGKTLLTIYHVKKDIEAENAKRRDKGLPEREIYHSGIKDLTLRWKPLDDAKQWHKLPVGSVIVIAECQTEFRPRGLGQNVPDYIAAFETHRHQGHDVYLITQHPMLLDQNIRRLVGRHWHVIRKFGLPVATIHEWSSTHELTQRNLGTAIKRDMKYPKEVFGYYKSAEEHTHKANVPKRVWFMLAAPLLVAFLVYIAYGAMMNVGSGNIEKVAGVTPQAAAFPASSGGGFVTAPTSQKNDLETYLAGYMPRLQGMPWTAPVYDDVTQPVDAPYPVACYTGSKGCRCYDQQNNRLAVTPGFCEDFIEHGMFIPWKVAHAGQLGQGGDVQTERVNSQRELIPKGQAR